jgi:hypothetical protein
MNISPRTQTLLDRLPKNHRLTPTMRGVIVGVSAANERFADYKNTLSKDALKTELGRAQALREAFTKTFGKDLIRHREPMTKARAEHTARKSALTIKDVDVAGVDSLAKQTQVLIDESRRQETRKYLLGLEPTLRIAKAMTGDKRILDALMHVAPELSGFDGFPRKIIDELEQRYLEITYPEKLAELDETDDVIAQGEAAVAIALNEMRSTVDVHPHDFDEMLLPIEVNRPWLMEDGKQVCEVDPATGKPSYRLADDSDRENGVKYKSFEAYKAAQGLDRAAA